MYQPIVDVARSVVVGYEALTRFPGQAVTSPEGWFVAAAAHGLAAELEALALEAALAHRSSLPTNCFLTVNLSPHLLADQRIQLVLGRQGDLGGLVIELTEQARIESYDELRPYVSAIRQAGGTIAVDDAGSGYAGLSHLLNLRPEIIKLDRELVADVDTDEAKRALIEMVGLFSSRIDAWVLAEGLERAEEADALLQLGVPLAQGFFFGRPGPPWPKADPDAVLHLASRTRPRTTPGVRHLLEMLPAAPSLDAAGRLLAADASLDAVVLVDRRQRPTGLADPSSIALSVPAGVLVANLDTPVHELARRAMLRHRWERFLPVVCTDNAGRYVGVVRMERIIEALTPVSPRIQAS